jgi:hypothetical protein
MMADPLVYRGAQMAFVGAEGEGGYAMVQDAIEVVPGTNTTIDGQPLGEIWADLQTRLSVFNTQMSFMVSLLTFPINRAQERVGVYMTPKFEEATELGRPEKVRLQYVFRGFPLRHYDLGFGYTQEFIDYARGSEISAIAAQSENAWWTLNFEVVMLSLFTEDNATTEDGVVVRRLYNADGEVPPHYKRFTHDGTHTHYLASGGAAITTANLDSIEEHLLHHGFGDFGETFILLANRVEMVDIRALTGFVPATSSTVPIIVDGQVVGAQRSGIPGLNAEGYYGTLVIVESNDVPAGYVFAFATGGQFAGQNPVGLRRHENPSISGLRLVEGPVARYPLIDAVYDGYLGAGVRHRGAGVVMQITAGAYTDPTF